MSTVPGTSSHPPRNTGRLADADVQVAPDWLGATVVMVFSVIASIVMVVMR